MKEPLVDRVSSPKRMCLKAVLASYQKADHEITRKLNFYGLKKDLSPQKARKGDQVLLEWQVRQGQEQIALLTKQKEEAGKELRNTLKLFPETKTLLAQVPGIGEIFIAACLAYVDITLLGTVSRFWAAFGLNPGEVELPSWIKGAWRPSGEYGRGDRRHGGHRPTFNAAARKAAYVASGNLWRSNIRSVEVSEEEFLQTPKAYQSRKPSDPKFYKSTPKDGSIWGEMMLGYKHRKYNSDLLVMHSAGSGDDCESSPDADGEGGGRSRGPGKMTPWKDVGAGRIHAAALRYGIKQAMIPIHIAWREFHDLPVRETWLERELGRKHGE